MGILTDKAKLDKLLEKESMPKGVSNQKKMEKLANVKYTKMDLSANISELWRMRDQFHLWHLQTKSYAAHKAMDSFYNAVLDFADTLAEAGMASGQVISNLHDITLIDWSGVSVVIDHLDDRCAYWDRQKELLEDRSDLDNEVESFILQMNKTKYLLTLS